MTETNLTSKNTLEKLKKTLENGGYTCVLSDGEQTVTSTKRGISPLIGLIESGKSFVGFAAADKVVGRAAALLYALMGVTALYAGVISAGALEVCNSNGIYVEYGKSVQYIINRNGDGVCPMEQATAQISDPLAAIEAIKQRLAQLGASNIR